MQMGRRKAIGLIGGSLFFLAGLGTREILERLGGSVAYAQESVPPDPNTDPTTQPGNPGQATPRPSPQIPPTPNTTPTTGPGYPEQGTATNTPNPTNTPTEQPTPPPVSPTATNTPTEQPTPPPVSPTATNTPTEQPKPPATPTPRRLSTRVPASGADTSGALMGNGSGRQMQGELGKLLGLGGLGLAIGTGLGFIIRRRMMLAEKRELSSPSLSEQLEENEIGGGQKPNPSSGNGGNNSGGVGGTIQQRFDFMGDDKNNAIF